MGGTTQDDIGSGRRQTGADHPAHQNGGDNVEVAQCGSNKSMLVMNPVTVNRPIIMPRTAIPKVR